MFKIIFFLFTLLVIVLCSDGDRSPFYNNCVSGCTKANCSNNNQFKPNAAHLQDMWSSLLMWNCRDECRYHCMWRTVQGFHERGYSTPKFHGKWPFQRILGVQEPASTLASLLNLAAHFYMFLEMKRQFPLKKMPALVLWKVFAMVCMNAWFWSTIFHSRDNAFTEFMDYACALSMVISLFLAAIIRVFHKRRKVTGVIVAATLLYYAEHARYLYSGAVDYDYNIYVNIFFGVLGSIIWLWWAGGCYVSGRSHVSRLVAFTLVSGATLSLELLDFPPRLGWDAHALWHLTTAPLPLLFYRFVLDDLHYLNTALPTGKSD